MDNFAIKKPATLHLFILFQCAAYFCGAIAEFRVVFVVAEVMSFGLLVILYLEDRLDKRTIIATALILRLVYMSWLPGLSDDAFRYIWDGMVQGVGISPFQYLPNAPELSSLHWNPVFEGLNSKRYFAVYPPISQFLFLAATTVESGSHLFSWMPSYVVIKIGRALAEMAAMLIVVHLLSARRSLLYALNPLVIIECAGQAHAEASMLLGLAIVIFGVRKSIPMLAVLGLVLASWTKIYPVLFLPIVLRKIGFRYLVPYLVLSLIIVLPFFDLEHIQNFGTSVDLYVKKFEFNAGIYYSLKKVVNWWTGRMYWGPTIGPILRFVFGLGAMLVLVQNFRGKQTWMVSAMWISTIYLITATTVHPWYLCSVLLIIPFLHPIRWEWIWLASFSIGTYLLYTHSLYWEFVIVAWVGWAITWLLRSHVRPNEIDY